MSRAVSMRIERGAIVIDDEYVCSFAARPGFLETCGAVLRAVCDAVGAAAPCSTAPPLCSTDAAIDARVCAALARSKGELAEDICARLRTAREAPDVTGVLTNVLTRIVDERVAMSASVQRLEACLGAEVRREMDACLARSKGELAEEICVRFDTRRDAREAPDVAGAVARLVEERDAMRKMVERVCAVLDDRAAASNRRKGDEGEVGLVEVLEGTMTVRDGFSIQRVGTIPHNCDILIRKTGKPDVRVECKAHGKDNGKPVATREVMRFEDDLKLLGNHGIFVSLYAPITGKAPFELRMLESNRVAIYLSNNHFDAAMIRDLVLLIYRVDELIHADGIVLSPGQLGHIRAGLDDLSVKAAQIQAHLRASLELVSSMCFSSVARMLTDAETPTRQEETVDVPVEAKRATRKYKPRRPAADA